MDSQNVAETLSVFFPFFLIHLHQTQKYSVLHAAHIWDHLREPAAGCSLLLLPLLELRVWGVEVGGGRWAAGGTAGQLSGREKAPPGPLLKGPFHTTPTPNTREGGQRRSAGAAPRSWGGEGFFHREGSPNSRGAVSTTNNEM